MWSFIYRALRKEAVASWRWGILGSHRKGMKIPRIFISARKLAFLSHR